MQNVKLVLTFISMSVALGNMLDDSWYMVLETLQVCGSPIAEYWGSACMLLWSISRDRARTCATCPMHTHRIPYVP